MQQADETTRILTAYVSYNGKAESPATLAESAEGCFKEDGDNGPCSSEVEGRASRGLSVGMAAVFLVAEMAGGGILSLPQAISNTGWTGIPMLVVLCLGVGFVGTRLGLCWVMLEQRWPEYRTPCKRPYPAIARCSFGKPGQYVVEFSVLFTLYGAATVYLLLSSQMTLALLGSFLPSVSQCVWILILGVLLCPTTWLKTPKDFWGAPFFAMGASLLATLVVVVEVILERNEHDPPSFTVPTFNSFFLGFGAILFAFGGASIFPTIQNDMKNRAEFPDSVVTTLLVLLAIYLPLCSICYGVLGSDVPDNIMKAVSGPAVTVTQVFLLCHFLFAFIIIINPVNQAFESAFNLTNEGFGLQRVVIRTCVMVTVILVGFTIPDFGKILNLIGSSTVSLMSFVVPPLCYLRLSANKGLDGLPQRKVPRWEAAVLLLVVVLGIVAGVASTYSAIFAIVEDAFASTCFAPTAFL